VQGTCHASNTDCSNGLGNCSMGSCGGGTCGGLGQPCCGSNPGAFCTDNDTRCLPGTSTCVECGGKGERCCLDTQNGEPLYCRPPFQQSVTNMVCFCK
jgi:hypothetical protein